MLAVPSSPYIVFGGIRDGSDVRKVDGEVCHSVAEGINEDTIITVHRPSVGPFITLYFT